MYTLNGWCFLSSGVSYPPVFTVVLQHYRSSFDREGRDYASVTQYADDCCLLLAFAP